MCSLCVCFSDSFHILAGVHNLMSIVAAALSDISILQLHCSHIYCAGYLVTSVSSSFRNPKGILMGGQFIIGTAILLNKLAIKGSTELPVVCPDDSHAM